MAAPVLVVDQNRLFSESKFGKASLERERKALADLEAENGKIQAELMAEEQELTLLRKTLPAEEFSARAEAFDQKVERIRSEQDAKSRDLNTVREQDFQAFFKAATPVLGAILTESGASVILDKTNVIVSLSSVDVTDMAITKIDEVLGEAVSPSP